ncbi:hypothetical protein JTB14_023210 [Gonioctena quinquepunctata]|nr:hypothetical protein JTB14_023210 [Gonioctena quinquepunctata]
MFEVSFRERPLKLLANDLTDRHINEFARTTTSHSSILLYWHFASLNVCRNAPFGPLQTGDQQARVCNLQTSNLRTSQFGPSWLRDCYRCGASLFPTTWLLRYCFDVKGTAVVT